MDISSYWITTPESCVTGPLCIETWTRKAWTQILSWIVIPLQEILANSTSLDRNIYALGKMAECCYSYMGILETN